jgi:hypothetical protein
MWATLAVTRSILEPSGHYWVIVNRCMQVCGQLWLHSFGSQVATGFFLCGNCIPC